MQRAAMSAITTGSFGVQVVCSKQWNSRHDMRYSRMFIPTVKEVPADAEIPATN